MDFGLLAIDENFTLVRLVQPVEDVHQCTFPGPVFSQQGKNLTFFQCEINMIVGQDPGKSLGDSTQFKDRRHISLFQGRIFTSFYHRNFNFTSGYEYDFCHK